MSLDALIETGVTVAAKVLFASIDALIEKADADEAAEIRRMLEASRGRLDAMPPAAESLDAIRDKNLERVRARRVRGLDTAPPAAPPRGPDHP